MFASKQALHKESAKAARATRGDHTTHVSRCLVRFHGSFFETPKANHLRRQLRSKSALENPKMDVRSGPGKPKNNQKSTKFRSRALSGALGRSGPLWGRRRDVLGTALRRQQAALGPILGRPGRAKSAREASKSLPGPVPRRPRTTPEQCLSAVGAPSAVAYACGTIFHLFCVVAHKL